MKKILRVLTGVVLSAAVLGATMGVSYAGQIRYKPLESDAPVVMTVNGEEIHADEYATYMQYNMTYYANMYAQMGLTDLWSNAEYASMLGGSMPEQAQSMATQIHVVMQKFDEAGLKLSQAAQDSMKQGKEAMIDQTIDMQTQITGQAADTFDREEIYLDLISQFGFSEQLYDNFMYFSAAYDALEAHLFGEGGAEAPSEQELIEAFQDSYIGAKHILIMTVDPSTGEPTRTDEEALALAQQALDRVNAGEDFDTVMNEMSEDSGLATYPDGYIFAEGEMVTEFYEGAKALAENAVSAPIKSDYGYHVIKRVPVDYAGQLETYRPTLLQNMGKTMDTLIGTWMEEADVQPTAVFDEINYQNVQTYLPAEVQARQNAQLDAVG